MNDSSLSEHDQNFVRASLAYRQATDILECFTDQSITVTPLKGVWFSKILYDDPAERFMGDVDLLVSPEDFDRAGQCLISMGYRPDETLKSKLSFGAVIERPYRREGCLPVELHRQVATGIGARRLSKEILRHGLGPDDAFPQRAVMTSNPEQTLTILALHFRDHGLRADDYQLEDVRQLIERLKPDIKATCRLAGRSAALIALAILLEITNQHQEAAIAKQHLGRKPAFHLLQWLTYRDEGGLRPIMIPARKGPAERAWRLALHCFLARDQFFESLLSQLDHLGYELRTLVRFLGK